MKAARLKPLSGEALRLWKLLTTHDLESLRHGLELASAFGTPLDGVLDGVDVDARGQILRSSRFSGTAAEQPVLDTILLHQLSLAPAGSRGAEIRQAVTSITVEAPLVPALRGFDALQELELILANEEGAVFGSLEGLGAMPALRLLTIKVVGEGARLETLDGLRAPQLQSAALAKLGLLQIAALNGSPLLERLDLGGNSDLRRLQGLESARSVLRVLDLTGCAAVVDLEPLDGATALESLKLDDCKALVSVGRLTSARGLRHLSLTGCRALTSLEGLPDVTLEPQGKSIGHYAAFSLRDCRALKSLRGLPRLSGKFNRLELTGVASLSDLSGIEAAVEQEILEIRDAPLSDLSPIVALAALERLELTYLPALSDLGPAAQLASLGRLYIRALGVLGSLPPSWRSPLTNLSIEDCRALQQLGSPAATLEELEIRGCPSLRSLSGLEHAKALKRLECQDTVADVFALGGLSEVTVSLSMVSLPPDPERLVRLFVGLPSVLLELRNIEVSDLKWIVELPNLIRVSLNDGCMKANGLTEGYYEKRPDVQKLQRKICKTYRIGLPAHLKPARLSAPRGTGLLSAKDLKRELTSANASEVSEGLRRLQQEGSPALYDELVQGTDPETAFEGDSRAIGLLFREVRAESRLLARWALTSILALAPDAAERAVGLRRALKRVTLRATDRRDPIEPRLAALSGLAMPALDGFTSLETLDLQGLAISDLRWIGTVPSLKRLDLDNLPLLRSLDGLSGVPNLESFDFERCPNLSNIDELVHLGQLKGPRHGGLNLCSLGPLAQVRFVSGLRALRSLQLCVAKGSDLSPFADAPSVQEVQIELDSWIVDLSPLSHVRNLHVRPRSWTFHKQPNRDDHDWRYEWPHLESLHIGGSASHRFADLVAPALGRVTLYGSARTLDGLGGIHSLDCSLDGVDSIDALAESGLQSLDLSRFPGRFEVVRKMLSLQRLTLPAELTPERAVALRGLGQITTLALRQFSGSLEFLRGWDALSTLDLRDSRQLTEIDVLLDLPNLQKIRLKGAEMKRERWPKALQERMTYRDDLSL